MMEASQNRGRDDAPVPLGRARPGWRMEVEGPMGTRLVGRGDERLDDPLQVPRVERNDVMHARASERPDPALGHGIRVRSPHRWQVCGPTSALGTGRIARFPPPPRLGPTPEMPPQGRRAHPYARTGDGVSAVEAAIRAAAG